MKTLKLILRFVLLPMAMLVTISANASLIGDTVNIGYVDNNANTLDSVVVSNLLEYTPGDGSNLAASVPGSIPVFDFIDIGADYIEIGFLLSVNAGASPAAFTFSSLDHLISASLISSDIASITSADLSFSGDTVVIDVGNQTPANYNPVAVVRIGLEIPEPGTALLFLTGLLGAGFARRRFA